MDDKIRIHEECLMLAYYSNGGVPYHVAYTMPIYLRVFSLRTLAKFKEKESPKNSKSNQIASEDRQEATNQGIRNRKMFRSLDQIPNQK